MPTIAAVTLRNVKAPLKYYETSEQAKGAEGISMWRNMLSASTQCVRYGGCRGHTVTQIRNRSCFQYIHHHRLSNRGKQSALLPTHYAFPSQCIFPSCSYFHHIHFPRQSSSLLPPCITQQECHKL